MARPEKKDVDYFPFYVKDGRTLFILESKYGCKGTGFFTNVMRFLCQTPEHYYQLKEETDRLYFFSRVHCDEESGMDMLNIMAKTGKIDAGLWVSGAVIVSQDLLDSISDAYRKRNNKIITIEQIKEKVVSGVSNEVSSADNLQASDISGVSNTQSKVNKSKVNKESNKEKILFEDNHFKNIPETLIEKWKSIAPGISIQMEITKAEAWVLSNPKLKKSNWSRFLTNWIVRAQDHVNKYGGNNANTGNKPGFKTYTGRQFNNNRELDPGTAEEADRINADYFAQKAAQGGGADVHNAE